MATMKKAQDGAKTSATAKMAAAKGFKSIKDPDYKPSTKKYKNGGSLGMKSVKSGYDKNPGVTRADIITAAKKAQGGIKVVPKNLNDRQIKRVERIGETNPERARKVGSRISDRRNARGAETSVKPMMKSGGKMKKCKTGCK